MRLLNPNIVEGGSNNLGGQTPPPAQNPTPSMPAPLTPHPDFGTPPVRSGEPPKQAPVWVDPADWTVQQRELQSLRQFKAEQDRAFEKAEQERIRLMAEKGQIEEAFKLQQMRHDAALEGALKSAKQIEASWLDERKATEISKALTGKKFAGSDPTATASMVLTLLAGEIEAVRDERGNPVIRDRTSLRPAVEYLQERLSSPEFAIFLEATNRGGSGTDGARPAAANSKQSDDPFADFASNFMKQMNAARGGDLLSRNQ